MLSIKRVVDDSRAAGQFVLSGSTRFLTVPTLSESLARLPWHKAAHLVLPIGPELGFVAHQAADDLPGPSATICRHDD